jgi:hypothetical protein
LLEIRWIGKVMVFGIYRLCGGANNCNYRVLADPPYRVIAGPSGHLPHGLCPYPAALQFIGFFKARHGGRKFNVLADFSNAAKEET